MSENIGKDGEMRFAITIAGASIRENGLDFTRHTVTNQPDLGVDYSAQGPADSLVKFCEIGTGTALDGIRETLGKPDRKVEARFDIKTTEEKLAGDTVEKFVSDVKKHPNTVRETKALVLGVIPQSFTHVSWQKFHLAK